MNTTETFIQSTCKAILHSCSELQRANDALQELDISLTHLSALRADMVRLADNERVEGIESRRKIESKMLALRQRAERAEATIARLKKQLLKATQGQLKVQRESELQLVLQQKDFQDNSAEATGENKARMQQKDFQDNSAEATGENKARMQQKDLQDSSAEATGENKARMQQKDLQDSSAEATGENKAPVQQKTPEKTVATPSKTSMTPREKTRTSQDECARVLASAKDVAASVGAGTSADSRARVRLTATA